jgi:hypothetical protein
VTRSIGQTPAMSCRTVLRHLVIRELRQKDIVVTMRLTVRTMLSPGMRSLECHLARIVVCSKSFLRGSEWQIQFGLIPKSIQIDVRF